MEHVYNFQKSKSPKVPKFKPSPPSPPEKPEREPDAPDSPPEVQESVGHTPEVTEPKETREKTFENANVQDGNVQVQETFNAEVKNAVEATEKVDAVQEAGDEKIDENIPDIQAEPSQDEIIASETGTNFDESLFYDEETIHKKEEEQFFYKFDDWNKPASSSPMINNALDYRSQKYFDELEGIERTVTNGNIVDDNQNTLQEHEKENVDKHQPKEESNIRESGHKVKEENKDDKKKGKKKKDCDCEKERKKLRGKKDKHYDEGGMGGKWKIFRQI